jgi:hypothetical protein
VASLDRRRIVREFGTERYDEALHNDSEYARRFVDWLSRAALSAAFLVPAAFPALPFIRPGPLSFRRFKCDTKKHIENRKNVTQHAALSND